jgi:hypothetical protein
MIRLLIARLPLLRRAAKVAIRPVTDPIWARVDQRDQDVRQEVEELRKNYLRLNHQVEIVHTEDLLRIRQELGELTGHIPALLNSIAAQNSASRRGARLAHIVEVELERLRLSVEDHGASVSNHAISIVDHGASFVDIWRTAGEHTSNLGSVWDELRRLTDRVEFIRREILIEQRYSQPARPNVEEFAAVVSAPVVKSPEKLTGSELRVNLGCGHLPLEGYVNVDFRDLPGVDVVADVARLPLDSGSVATLHAAHLLEHFPAEQLTRQLLPYWTSLLRPGGQLVVVVPDSEAMLEAYARGDMGFDELREVTFGGQEYDGDFHFAMFSQDSLGAMLKSVGLADIEVTAHGRRNGLCYEMELTARRPQ